MNNTKVDDNRRKRKRLGKEKNRKNNEKIDEEVNEKTEKAKCNPKEKQQNESAREIRK